MSESLASLFRATWSGFILRLREFLPQLVSVVALVVVGWVVAFALRSIARWLLRWIRLDALLERVGITPALGKLGGLSPHALVSSVLFWVVWLTFLLSGLHALGLEAAQRLAEDAVRLIPSLAVALAVVVIGYSIANFLWRAVLLWGASRGVAQAQVLGGMVRGLVLIATFAMALEQVGIGERIIQTAFAILVGGISLGVAIAVGLGGRHIARRYLENLTGSRPRESPKDEKGAPHL